MVGEGRPLLPEILRQQAPVVDDPGQCAYVCAVGCFKCGEVGHMSRDCPSGGGGGGGRPGGNGIVCTCLLF